MPETHGNDAGRDQFTPVEVLQLLLDGCDGQGGRAAPVLMPTEFQSVRVCASATVTGESKRSSSSPSADDAESGESSDKLDGILVHKESLVERLEDEQYEIEKELQGAVLARNRLLRAIDWEQSNVLQPCRVAYLVEKEKVDMHRRVHLGCRCRFPTFKQYKAAWKESKYNLKKARGKLDVLRKQITSLDLKSREFGARIDEVYEEIVKLIKLRHESSPGAGQFNI
ncbi:hypothetical protein AAF712_010914 [Marasmius tenuissimus]|uniref:Uncharacterized protein n=1 Tax=Marasmius tenuissimus TaxID=585030 RepID=A0ABR2ZPB9_9AGAR